VCAKTHIAPCVQFERLRNGDRFWYERKGMFSANELTQIYQTVRCPCPPPPHSTTHSTTQALSLRAFLFSPGIGDVGRVADHLIGAGAVDDQTLMDIVNRNMNVSKWGTVPGDTFFLRQRYLANIGTLIMRVCACACACAVVRVRVRLRVRVRVRLRLRVPKLK
jgi:hypothetical protein